MRAGRFKKIPQPTIARLSTYLQCLRDLEKEGVRTVSSREIAQRTGINAAQFRKDLSYFGEFGKPGVGYQVSHLKQRIMEQMGLDEEHPVLLVGAGSLGSALAGYPGFPAQGFRIEAIFDNNPMKVGQRVAGITIEPLESLRRVNSTVRAKMAIIAVPREGAQDVADRLVRNGIKCILNFAPIKVNVPDDVVVRNVDLTQELEVLSYYMRAMEAGQGKQ